MDTTTIPAASDRDIDLEAEVCQAIMALDGLRPTHAEVSVSVRDGHVTLTGIVQSPMQVVEIEHTAAAVPGVTGVTNHVLDDGSLDRQIAEALAADPRTRDVPPGYRVNSLFGYVTITGRFTVAQARDVITIAQAIPGVRTVNVKAI